MAIPRFLKAFQGFVDGKGYFGKVPEIVMPKLARKMVEHRDGGMPGPVDIDMGSEKITGEFTVSEPVEDMLRLFGTQDVAGVPLKFKGSFEADGSEGTKTPVTVTIRGRFSEVDLGTWKTDDPTAIKYAYSGAYFLYEQGGEALVELDMVNGVYKVNGVDMLATTNSNIGLTS